MKTETKYIVTTIVGGILIMIIAVVGSKYVANRLKESPNRPTNLEIETVSDLENLLGMYTEEYTTYKLLYTTMSNSEYTHINREAEQYREMAEDIARAYESIYEEHKALAVKLPEYPARLE